MAESTKTVAVWMLSRVRGENGEALVERSRQEVSARFARELIFTNRAEPYDGQDGAEGDDDEGIRFTSKAAAEAADEAELEPEDFEGREGTGRDGAFTKADVEAIAAELTEEGGEDAD